MATEMRCERTDLLVAECDHCRPKPAPFEAQYPGNCATCGGLVYVGEQIRERPDGSYEHGRHK